MKKSIVLGLLGLAAATATSFGQGFITLDNYLSNNSNGFDPVTYGINVPANGVSGANGNPGIGLNASWTAGIYFVVGTPTINDPAGNGIPNALLSPGTGSGSTATFQASAFNTSGEFSSIPSFNSGGTAGDIITVELVAWDSAATSYATAAYRGHSTAFQMTTVSITSQIPSLLGDAEKAAGTAPFSVTSVTPVPEPSTIALAGLSGLASFITLRRKKA